MACLPIFSNGFVDHAIVVDRMGSAHFHRNLLRMTVVASGLHFYLFTYRTQGKRLKYDAPEQLEKSGNFSFRNQV
tara:strand:- start:6918 stop:7142 length:225 start_codon:yes stop_codon:yes gene_type:complete